MKPIITPSLAAALLAWPLWLAIGALFVAPSAAFADERIGVMAAILVGMVTYFRRRGWL